MSSPKNVTPAAHNELTSWDAWQHGLKQAKEAMAAGEQPTPGKDRADRFAREMAEAFKRRDAPVTDRVAPRFCPAEGCGLTVAPGAARCWIHKPAGTDETKEGQLR